MGKRIAIVFFLLCLGVTGQEKAYRAVTITKALAKRIGECSRREVVARFKKEWEKQAWGPPTDVKIDVEKTNSQSILYAYKGIVEFSVAWSYGQRRKTQREAAADTELESSALPKAKYRNLYKLGNEEPVLDAREVLTTSGEWKPRQEWPDACWDHVALGNDAQR